jgi:hypothetical protein
MEIFSQLPNPEEIRLTLTICGGLLVGLLMLWLIGRLLARGSRDSVWPTLLPFAGVLTLIGLVSLYLDTRPVVTGAVIAKSESVETQPDGGWEYHFRPTVQYTRPDEAEPRREELTTDEETYDSLSVGDEVGVRYWNAGGLFDFARLSNRSTVQMVWDAGVQYFVLLVLACVLLGWLVGKATGKKATGIIFGMAAFAAAVFSLQALGQLALMLPMGGHQIETEATVRSVSLYTKTRSSEQDDNPTTLIQPFDLVEVEFVPQGRAEPVVALDRIDTESYPLELGGTVPIVYRTDRPRQIQLAVGSHTYLWKNPAASLALLGGMLFIGFIVFRRGRRAQQVAQQGL